MTRETRKHFFESVACKIFGELQEFQSNVSTIKPKKLKFKVMNMESELNAYLVMLELTGLQYFSLKTISKENFKQRPSVLRLVQMLFLLTVITSSVVIFIISDHSHYAARLSAKNVMMYAIQHSMNINLVLVAGSCLVQSFVSTRSTKKIFLNLREISELCFRDFKVPFDFVALKRASWKRFFFMIIGFSIMHGALALNYSKQPDVMLQIAFGTLPMLFLNFVSMKFIFYVNLVNFELNLLGHLMKNIFKPKTLRVYDLISVKTLISVDPHNVKLRKLQTARKIYNLIYETGNLVNDSNGLTVLIFLTSFVIALTASGYEIFVIIIGDLETEKIAGKPG